MITPVNFKSYVNFSGSKDTQKGGVDDASKKVLIDCLKAAEDQDIFIPASHGPAADYVNSLVEQGYDYTAACDEGDRFARCLASHENV